MIPLYEAADVSIILPPTPFGGVPIDIIYIMYVHVRIMRVRERERGRERERVAGSLAAAAVIPSPIRIPGRPPVLPCPALPCPASSDEPTSYIHT
ncbi:hypothetical protein K504DRAFT_151708 [Pleomassaria siparia CBS 279.74]|uniref:Uncharacterized protein n=1 Tax=Pleomassaria siparia CBS 279.74 TaxID=1314801 RepID=A0A6G1KMC7_9PLEO|nr:hypothetical protein K504DRAFT_151708 [Pleomassaria siparia CBS 279.74]